MSDDLADPFERLVAAACPTALVRTGDTAAPWAAFEESGFLDALVPADRGGAGLDLAAVAPLLAILGYHAVPMPVADTMAARFFLDSAPAGPIVLATSEDAGTAAAPLGSAAEHALVDDGAELLLVSLEGSAPDGGPPRFAWRDDQVARRLPRPPEGLLPTIALLRASEIAGLADRVLQMAVAHANQRVQFGKPIGRQQAIQQQLAVMAERALLARIAAQMGCAGGLPAAAHAAAPAKCVTSAIAGEVAAAAHAVHGAIGLTDEHDLALFTRRLHRARWSAGSESYWARIVGGARLRSGAATTLDFVRALERQGEGA